MTYKGLLVKQSGGVLLDRQTAGTLWPAEIKKPPFTETAVSMPTGGPLLGEASFQTVFIMHLCCSLREGLVMRGGMSSGWQWRDAIVLKARWKRFALKTQSLDRKSQQRLEMDLCAGDTYILSHWHCDVVKTYVCGQAELIMAETNVHIQNQFTKGNILESYWSISLYTLDKWLNTVFGIIKK